MNYVKDYYGHCATCTCPRDHSLRGEDIPPTSIQRGLPTPKELREASEAALAKMGRAPMRQWYTYEQAALICLRSPFYLKSLVSKYKLERRLVRGPGPRKTFVIMLSEESVMFLRRRLLGI
jgi:hypothetical protein